MNRAEQQPAKSWWIEWSQPWSAILRRREEQVFLGLTLLIGCQLELALERPPAC